MFKGLKSSGFNIEDSHVRDRERMSNLFSIIMIEYVWCYLVGIFIHENIKPIKILKLWRRAVNLFKYGLDYISQCLMNHTERYQINVFKFFVIYLAHQYYSNLIYHFTISVIFSNHPLISPFVSISSR